MKSEEFVTQVLVGVCVAIAVLFIERHMRASHDGCKCSGGGAKSSAPRGFCGVR